MGLWIVIQIILYWGAVPSQSLNSQSFQYSNAKVWFNTTKKSSTRMSTHMIVNKSFLSATTAQPWYPQRFEVVSEWRILACLRVFTDVTTVTPWGKAANCMELRKSYDIVHKLWYSVICTQLLLTTVSTLRSADWVRSCRPHNITRRQWFLNTETLTLMEVV